MINVDKQVEYWRKGAEEEWEVANELISNSRLRQGLFFAHLALEKALKAHVCKATQNEPPRIHDLPRLAQIAQLQVSPEQLRILEDMNDYVLLGR